MTTTHQRLGDGTDSGFSSRPSSSESDFFETLHPSRGSTGLGRDFLARFWVHENWPRSTANIQGRCVRGKFALTIDFKIDEITSEVSVRPTLQREGNVDGITVVSVTKSAFEGVNIHVDLPSTLEEISRPINAVAQLVVYDKTLNDDSDEELGFRGGSIMDTYEGDVNGGFQHRQPSIRPDLSRNGVGGPARSTNGFTLPGGRSSRPNSSMETDDQAFGGCQQRQHSTMSDRSIRTCGGVMSNGIINHNGRASRPSSCSTPKPAPRKFEIFVKYFGGSPTNFEVTDTTRVEDLKDMIAKNPKIGYPKSQQRLLFQGQDLQDTKTLVYYGVKENSTIDCVGRLRGG